ncbi:unnamed protein product [Haemonchus placei]|uniref:Ovule protein n=1 Tax=Haemonchus placei TaxID=6290 RepID=A0A0N4WU41_HAEPC|nr:unnamed protein product [Haemonchus placei]
MGTARPIVETSYRPLSIFLLESLRICAFCVDSNSIFQFGKPCSSSFQCWRTEPILDDGLPISIERTKRLEIASKTRGGELKKLFELNRLG